MADDVSIEEELKQTLIHLMNRVELGAEAIAAAVQVHGPLFIYKMNDGPQLIADIDECWHALIDYLRLVARVRLDQARFDILQGQEVQFVLIDEAQFYENKDIDGGHE